MIPEHNCGIKLYPKIYHAYRKIAIKKELLAAQKYKCYWCHCSLHIWWKKDPSNPLKRIRVSVAELDHIIPRCAGGNNEISNLVMACQRCNRIRGTLFMRGVRYFIIIGQESPQSILNRYKQHYSSNQYTRKKYATRATESRNTNSSQEVKTLLDCSSD